MLNCYRPQGRIRYVLDFAKRQKRCFRDRASMHGGAYYRIINQIIVDIGGTTDIAVRTDTRVC